MTTTEHISLLCKIVPLPHKSCSGTCDGHRTGQSCDQQCQCPCHLPWDEPWYPGDTGPEPIDNGGSPASTNVSHETGLKLTYENWLVQQYQFKPLEARCVAYRRATEGRDQLVKDLLEGGYNRWQISLMTGIARTTIYRILGARYRQDHGTQRYTEPRFGPQDGER